MSSVQCVPGGRSSSLSDTYWCQRCGFYLCYKHADTGTFTSMECPMGHDVTRSR
jgi:hypothetical protein